MQVSIPTADNSLSLLVGFGDTATPFKCSVLLNVINYLLDPIFIFTLGLGAGGVAAATAVSQYAALVPLLWILQGRVRLKFRGHWRDLFESMRQYGEAGFYLMIRTLARIAAFTYCSRQSVRPANCARLYEFPVRCIAHHSLTTQAMLGSVAASAYSITFQIGFFITLVYESISVAVQTLLSRELADLSHSPSMRRKIAAHLIRTSLLSGMGMALLLTSVVYTGRFRIAQVFSTSTEVQEATLVALPAFLTTQCKFPTVSIHPLITIATSNRRRHFLVTYTVVKSVSFPVNGVILGEMDWRFSMLISWLANAVCFATLRFPSGPPTVARIWTAWSAFFGTQAVCGLLRYTKKAGEWKKQNENELEP